MVVGAIDSLMNPRRDSGDVMGGSLQVGFAVFSGRASRVDYRFIARGFGWG